jgi:hypothetical protein
MATHVEREDAVTIVTFTDVQPIARIVKVNASRPVKFVAVN